MLILILIYFACEQVQDHYTKNLFQDNKIPPTRLERTSKGERSYVCYANFLSKTNERFAGGDVVLSRVSPVFPSILLIITP